MTAPVRDLRFALRRLAQAPLFTTLTVFTLALGIGAVAAVFSVLDGVLLKPLPFEDSERLVSIWYQAPGVGPEVLPQSPSMYFTYREQSSAFSESGIWQLDEVAVTGLAEPQHLDALYATEGVLPALRIQPALGRTFSAADVVPESPATVMLSDAYFQRQFGGDPAALGKMLTVDGRERTIIGVLGPDFRFPGASSDLLLPLRFDRAELQFGQFGFRSVARLADGVTHEQAAAEMARLIPGAIESYPMPTGFTKQMIVDARLTPEARPLKRDVIGNVSRMLWVIFGTVGLVLVIACANVANLFLARSEGRQGELAVKTALGASRRQVAGELLTESFVLSLVGALLGLGLAWSGLQVLVDFAPRGLPRVSDIQLDARVLAFTAAAALLTALAFGGVSVLRLGGANFARALKDEGRGGSASRGRRQARNALVVAQVALALVLLVGSGLLLRTFEAMRDVHPGFEKPEELLTFRLSIPGAEVEEPAAVVRLYEAVAEKLRAIPGVASVGFTSSVPMDRSTNFDPIFVEDHPVAANQIPPVRRMKFVTPDSFATLGTPLLAGRDVSWSEVYQGARVAVVSESLALAYWPNAKDAVGKRIRETPQAAWREIIGVAADVKDDGVAQPAPPIIYWPVMMKSWWGEEISVQRSMGVVVRSGRVGTPGFLTEVQRAVWSVNSNLPLVSVRTQAKILEESMATTSFTVLMLLIAALAALLLGSVGIYGVTSYVAAQRTREIGVRMALGARRQDVAALVLRHGVTLAALGVGLGLIAAVGVTRVLAALLYGVSPLDPLTFTLVGLLVLLAATLATYAPARRAAKLDPIESLRR